MKLVQTVSTTGVAALAVLLAHVSGALAGEPTSLPEPSMIAFFAMGVIGLIVVSRLRK